MFLASFAISYTGRLFQVLIENSTELKNISQAGKKASVQG